MAAPKKTHTKDMVRPSIYVSSMLWERVRYWSDKNALSMNDFVQEALEEKCARMNGDGIGNESVALARLNELIDLQVWAGSQIDSLTDLVSILLQRFQLLVATPAELLADMDAPSGYSPVVTAAQRTPSSVNNDEGE